jgi:hypothetical protein
MRKLITSPWTDEETSRLKQLVMDGASPARCSAALNKPISSVTIRARKLGLPLVGKRAAKANFRAKLADAERGLPRGAQRNDGSYV